MLRSLLGRRQWCVKRAATELGALWELRSPGSTVTQDFEA
jgi:hypothetical protein